MLNAGSVADLVHRELQRITDPDLSARIRELLVLPHPVERDWDYGAPCQKFTCWTVLEDPASNSGIAYCPKGFGPTYPWGLVLLAGPHLGIGMDSAWHASLEDAMRNSMAWHGTNPDGYTVP